MAKKKLRMPQMVRTNHPKKKPRKGLRCECGKWFGQFGQHWDHQQICRVHQLLEDVPYCRLPVAVQPHGHHRTQAAIEADIARAQRAIVEAKAHLAALQIEAIRAWHRHL